MRVITLFIFSVMVGCTSIHPITNQTFTQESLRKQLNVEERIWLLKKDGEDYRNLIIDSIEETYLLGHNNEADVLIIPYSSIARIETYHFNMGKTIALALPSAILLSVIIWAGTSGGVAL